LPQLFRFPQPSMKIKAEQVEKEKGKSRKVDSSLTSAF
jgi:hypothetical protein